MRTVQLSEAAEEDLKQIWAYVAHHNPEAADKLIREIISRFALTRDHPYIGRSQDRLLIGLRSIVVRDYFIFYQPFDEHIDVLRILHSARDIESLMNEYFDSL